MGPAHPLRVLIADTQSLFRDGLAVALNAQPDVEVVAAVPDLQRAVHEARRLPPDVILIDAGLPEAVPLAQRLLAEVPGCGVVLLFAEEDEDVLDAAVRAGVRGYVGKTSGLPEVLDAVRAIRRGEARIPPRLVGPLLDRILRRHGEEGEARARIGSLTKRERQVLAILAQGRDTDAIAAALVISPETARTHVQNVLTKLGVHSRGEAAALARIAGLAGG